MNIGYQSTRIGIAEYDENRNYMDELSLENLKKRDILYFLYIPFILALY